MNKFIAIPINLFTLDQQIMLYDTEQNKVTEFAKVELAKLPEVLADLAHVQQIHNIKLIGNKYYAQAIKSELDNYVITNYAEHQLNVEILEG